MLSDVDILEILSRDDDPLRITPYEPENIQPASVDVTLGSGFELWEPSSNANPLAFAKRMIIDPRVPSLVTDIYGDHQDLRTVMSRRSIAPGDPYELASGGFVIASTLETFSIPRDIVARVEGRSSLGRIGILVHLTAGFIDPGFKGQITLEILNVNPNPVKLIVGMRIAQLSFAQTKTPAQRGYQGKYQHQAGPTTSRLAKDACPPTLKPRR
jgi:dCTP deaminase